MLLYILSPQYLPLVTIKNTRITQRFISSSMIENFINNYIPDSPLLAFDSEQSAIEAAQCMIQEHSCLGLKVQVNTERLVSPLIYAVDFNESILPMPVPLTHNDMRWYMEPINLPFYTVNSLLEEKNRIKARIEVMPEGITVRKILEIPFGKNKEVIYFGASASNDSLVNSAFPIERIDLQPRQSLVSFFSMKELFPDHTKKYRKTMDKDTEANLIGRIFLKAI